MEFSERLMEKIQVDQWAARLQSTIGPPASGAKIDKEAARALLSRAPFSRRDERGLELWVRDADHGREVLVLDNELPLYRGTDVADVVVRKNPYVREMFKPRNFLHILWDTGARITRRHETASLLHELVLSGMDLSFSTEDVEKIRLETAASLTAGLADRVSRGLGLFAELLGLTVPPAALPDAEVEARGAFSRAEGGKLLAGPLVLYHEGRNRLVLVPGPVPAATREDLARMCALARGDEQAGETGEKALRKLVEMVLERYRLAPGSRATAGKF